MNWLKNILGATAAEGATKIVDAAAKFSEGHLGKKELALEIEQILDAQDARRLLLATATVDAKMKVMVAELQQGDTFTKRARPSVVYVGLGAMLLQGFAAYTSFTLPPEFWYAWAGAVGIYSYGRSIEKSSAATANGNATP